MTVHIVLSGRFLADLTRLLRIHEKKGYVALMTVEQSKVRIPMDIHVFAFYTDTAIKKNRSLALCNKSDFTKYPDKVAIMVCNTEMR